MVELEPQSFHVIEGDGVAPEQDESANEYVGAFLREARENTGRSVADIASSLRIRATFLQSIEDGRYEDLPGQTYAVGFIRSYADYLGLETATLLEQFKTESSGRDADSDLDFPEPSTDGWFPTGKVVASCAVLAVVVFAGWFFLQNGDSVDVAAVPSPPGFESALSAQAVSENSGDVEILAPDEAAVEPALPVEPEAAESFAADSIDSADTEADAPLAPTDETTSNDTEQPVQEPEQVAAAPAPAEPAVTEPEPQQSQDEPQPAETVTEVLPPTAAEPPVKVVEAPAEVAEPPAVNEDELTPASSDTAEATPQPVTKPKVAKRSSPAPAPATSELDTLVAALPSIPADEGVANNGDDGRTYGVVNQESRVVIGARADSWVQVLDANQNVLMTRMLRPGDRYMVPDRNDLVMLTGNAGGLIISVDGDTIPRIGSDGAILHNVRLDVELLRAGRAVIQ